LSPITIAGLPAPGLLELDEDDVDVLLAPLALEPVFAVVELELELPHAAKATLEMTSASIGSARLS
jgi:hypothetical protein